jgi:hypothetical protein
MYTGLYAYKYYHNHAYCTVCNEKVNGIHLFY